MESCPRCGKEFTKKQQVRTFCEFCGVKLAPAAVQLPPVRKMKVASTKRMVVAGAIAVLLVIGVVGFFGMRKSAGPRNEDGLSAQQSESEKFKQLLLSKWKDGSGHVSITFERNSAVLQDGDDDAGEVSYDADPVKRLVTFKMPKPEMVVTAKLGDDGTLRLQSSGRPGHLVILHRVN